MPRAVKIFKLGLKGRAAGKKRKKRNKKPPKKRGWRIV